MERSVAIRYVGLFVCDATDLKCLIRLANITCFLQCPTQAWSASCLIDLYMDAAEYQA